MIEDFIKELKRNQKINKTHGLENKVDIGYVIERLEAILLDYQELDKLLEAYTEALDIQCDLLEDEYKRKKRVKKYLNEDNRDDYDFSRTIILEMLEGDV